MATRTPRIPDAALARIPGVAKYRMATAGAEIIIGGDHATLTLPEARASKWGGECWLRVRHADAAAMRPQDRAKKRTENGKTVLELPVSAKGRRHEIREGSLKWDVVYDDPSALPADGIERFQLEFPEGLTWYYQPELTAEEIAEGAERPDNVVGSYAGYFDKAGCYLDQSGEEIANYETGKFAHLFRPEMVDAVGNRCWAVQELVGSELRVMLPAEWMATAVFPVRLDPTFGYDGVGSSLAVSANTRGSAHTLPVAGDVSSITCYWYSTENQTGNINYCIYRASDDALMGHVGTTDVSTLGWLSTVHGAWYEIAFSTPVGLSAANYVLVGMAGNTSVTGRCMRYDAVSSYRYFKSDTSTTPSNPFNGTAGTAAFKYSIYATYTESSGTSGTFAAPSLSVTPTITAGTLSAAQTGAATAPSLSITPTITAGTLTGNQTGDFSAPSLSITPAISAGTLSGAQTGTATAPSLSVQPVVSAGTLLGSGAGTFTAPSVSVAPSVSAGTLAGAQAGNFLGPAVFVQPTVSAGTLEGAQTGNFLSPAVSVQPAISAGTLTGASGATFLAPTLSVTPVVAAGTLSGAQTGTATAPSLSVQPTVSAGVLVGQQGGNFLGPALFVHPSISAGTLSGIAVSSGAFVAPGVSVHPVIRAGSLSGGSTAYRTATIMAERRQFILMAERKY